MTKDSGDDGMPELDDISKIGKRVRTRTSQKTISQDHQDTRPYHKTIKTQDHLTRPFHQTTKTQDKTISDVDCTAFRIHTTSEAEQTNKQKNKKK